MNVTAAAIKALKDYQRAYREEYSKAVRALPYEERMNFHAVTQAEAELAQKAVRAWVRFSKEVFVVSRL